VRCLLGGLVERRQVRQVFKRVWVVWRERVRVEVGVVVGRMGRDLWEREDLRVVRLGRRHGRLREGWVRRSVGFSMLSIYFLSKKAFYNNCN